ncbi:MAG: DUF1887 family CARF protein [Caldimonas manganoxidans]|uniref:Card1-like endonuclease domain-containing protein n=1 Tax=Caldimonas taiwanensis TaxID=307483 RepID=UPI000785FCB0|nr:DUF1887 family CARF protein [Caldimonas taiwanensis]MCX7659417.1 DUF1887 family CARF protein [Caldimonas manganoxidans]
MTAPALHIVIATEQNMANLIPALQCQAQTVWILQTPKMRAQRSPQHLADALKARGIATRCIDFPDEDIATMHANAEQLAASVGTQAVTINLTGGTKLMALSLMQTLAADLATRPGATAAHLVYCDTAHKRLEWLAPQPRSEPMQAVLRIEDVLRVQGYRIQDGSGGAHAAQRQRQAQERSTLTRWIGDHSARIGNFFGVLNHIAAEARGDGQRPFAREQTLPFRPKGEAAELLSKCHQAGLIHWQSGSSQVVFHDEEAAEYLSGGWIEEYAARKIKGAQPNGGQCPNLQIEHVDTKTRNELDAVLVHDNRMLVVECKAASVKDDVSDWIYKLAQLTRSVGGVMAQGLLLSARELNEQQRERAHEYRIKVLAAAQLRDLPDCLRDWMQGVPLA